jgi:hypothetical protein
VSQNENLIPTDDGGGNPIEEGARECLARVRLASFTAEPTTTEPFGPPATLTWRAAVPDDCRISLRLNGSPVGTSGSQRVEPLASTTYTLTAQTAGGLRRTLGTTSVRVDTRACVTVPVPESLLRNEITKAVRAFDTADGRVKLRSDPGIEVDTGGVQVALRFKLAIDNFADPDLDVDMVIGVRIRNGAAEPFYRRFAVDVDWPWWVTAISAGVSKVVEEFIESKIEARLRRQILTAVKAQIDDLVERVPGDLRLHSVRLGRDQLSVTACPAGGETRFLVVASPGRAVDDGLG